MNTPGDPGSSAAEDRASALDRALAPLRRLLVFARTTAPGQGPPRHVEPNALRWIDRAITVAEPDDRPALDGLKVHLAGVDAAPDRSQRLDALFQELTRFDAVRGLPLPAVDRLPPRRAAPPVVTQSREPAPEPRGATHDRRPPGAPAPRRAEVSSEARLDALLPAPLAEALAAAGLEVLGDLGALPPDTEEVLAPIHGAGRPVPPGRVALGGRVRRRWSIARPGAPTETRATLHGAGVAELVWSETPALLRQVAIEALIPESRAVVVGTWEGGQLREPEVVTPAGEGSDADDRRTVRLPVCAGVDGRLLRAAVHALAPSLARMREILPAEVVAAAGLPSPGEAITGLHLRASAEARRRFAFEELFLLEIGLAWPRFSGPRERGLAHPVQHGLLARLAPQFDLALDDAQALAFEDVKRDLRRSAPTLRVLSGPVDRAATLAFHAAILVAESRAQVLVLCPDALGAEERSTHVEALFREAGFTTRAVVGEPTRGLREALRRGEVQVVFGGADLPGHELEWRRLGLVVVFERPPYGAIARAVLAETRAGRPDVLVVPGDVVPWSTAARAWPTADVTSLGDPSRPVHVEVVPASSRSAVYARAAARAPREQILLTFPLVNGTDAVDLRDALRLVRALETDGFAGLRIALYHGSMSREERARVADDVSHHRVDVVVATTRYEEGGPLGRVSAVLVEQAQSEDPARVRQLASLARGASSWLALILADEATAPTWISTLSGARPESVAEGCAPAPQLRWLPSDDVAWQARRLAHELLTEDPGLRRSPELARQVRERWSEWFPTDAEEPDDADDDEGGWPCPIAESAAAAGEARPGEKKRRRRRKKKR